MNAAQEASIAAASAQAAREAAYDRVYTTCPECRGQLAWDGIDVYDCLGCGVWFTPTYLQGGQK